ncbi:MAG TPA: hypothetical protein VNG12_00370 [Acidimicrobiales bacterium]|nr:hypothetical protein [Acidimicrobiales bacterium]
MTTTLGTAEESVATLIERANRMHGETVASWTYELTADVDNIGVAVSDTAKTLRVNPCWLRFVLASGDFTVCVADEIEAWYLIQALTQGI